jgi:hypothetical protein
MVIVVISGEVLAINGVYEDQFEGFSKWRFDMWRFDGN